MPEMKTLGGYEVVDAKAREDLTGLRNDLPTKVSQLQNDSKFITRDEVPEMDLSEYITENELLAKGYLTEHQDISGKADKVHSHPEYLTEHQSLADYAKKSEIPDVSDFISEIPSEYITETELNAKGYLTEHQSLEGYVTKNYVDTVVAECKDVYFLDFSNATAAGQVADDQMISLAQKLGSGKKDISVMIKVPSSPYYWPAIIQDNLSDFIFSPIAFNPNDVGNIAWDVIRLRETWEGANLVWKYSLIASSTVALATEQYVDDAIANVTTPEVDVDLTGYATEEYVNNTIANRPWIEILNVTGASSTASAIQPDAWAILNRLASGEKFCICLRDGTTHYYPAWYSSSPTIVNIKLPVTFLAGDSFSHDKIESTEYHFALSDNQWNVTRTRHTRDLDWEV